MGEKRWVGSWVCAKIEVLDADTGVQIGVVSIAPNRNGVAESVNLKLPSNVKALKFTPLTPIGVGQNLLSRIRAVDYDVEFNADIDQEEGIRTHYYKKVITEIPGDAPSVEIPELKVTRYQTEDGTDIKDSETGFVDAPNTIGNYQFTGTTNTNEGGDVQTHIYAKIVTEVPGDAPQVDIPELQLTRHVSEKGKELLPIEEGSNGPRKTIGDYEYTGRTDVEGGITTHVYAPIRYELPGDAPQYDIPELKVTRHVDEKGKGKR